jgi:NitT/TauT family transport system permease protein
MKINFVSLLGSLLAIGALSLSWVIQGESRFSISESTSMAWAWMPLFIISVLALIGSLLRPRIVSVALLILGIIGPLIGIIAFKDYLAAGFDEAALTGYWLFSLGLLLVGAGAVGRLSMLVGTDRATRILRDFVPPLAVPFFFFLIWEGVVEGLRVPMAFFPRLTDVTSMIVDAWEVLVRDSIRTFVRQVLFGYIVGASLGLAVGVVVAFSRFLQKGLLPYATAFSAIPIVGLAPVLGRAFGVDWESKAAVVVIVSFFPMVINVVQGLTTVNPLQMDLMRSYAAKPKDILTKLRFPNALPYVFNALKLASIIGLISVIVSEFLIPGPPQGLGQRISLSARSGQYDLTFAAIAFASVIGILFYSAISVLERIFTGWHSSFREGRSRN